jgi:DNA modification methylase
VLKPTGSLYLHCDPTASHYLKLLLDAVFGVTNYRTEISWRRQSAHNDAAQGRQQYGSVRDIIFFYTKSGNWTWNWLYTPYDKSYVDGFYRHVEEGTQRRYRLGDITAPGGATPSKRNPHYEFLGVTRYWRYSRERMQELYDAGRIIQTKPGRVPQYKRYLDEMPGVALQNDWTDIRPLHGAEQERLGYPTQKPLALLERIISASSNPGDVVLDPFCGCGTAVHAAEKLGRRWIGIDITHLSIALIEKRLRDAFPGISFITEGLPKDLASAQLLADRDKHEFQKWVVTWVGGRPWKGGQKGADGGIDGLIFFDGFDAKTSKAVGQKAIISVKGGATKGVGFVADLVESIGRNGAALGILIMAALPTKEMEARAAAAGFVDTGTGAAVPRIQILTLAELFQGKRPVIPNVSTAMFKAAPEEKGQATLDL